MKSISSLLLALFLSACASVHPGNHAKIMSGNPDLEVSIEKNLDYSDPTNQFYTVTIENKGTEWLRVDEVDLDFSNTENVEHRMVVGPDLKAWIDSTAVRMQVKEQNDHMLDQIVGISGAVVMVASAAKGDRSGLLLGGATTAGAAAHETFRQERQMLQAAESARMVPESHLYAPFTVPSGGFRRAWFVVHTPQKRVTAWGRLKLKTVEGKDSEAKLPLAPGVEL